MNGGRIREVLYVGCENPVLRSVAAKVNDPGSEELKQLFVDMIATMKHKTGTGIAAPQIGVGLRVIVYYISEERAKREGSESIPIIGIANPSFSPETDEMEEDWEGCLSVPGMRGKVPRFTKIKYTGINIETGKPVEAFANGFHARVLQHEIDHLDGILYIDKATETKKFQ